MGLAVTTTASGDCGVAEPVAGLTLSQLPPVDVCALAENASVPVPAFDTFNTCVKTAVGLSGKVNDKPVLSTASWGLGPGTTWSVTVTMVFTGVASGDVMVSVAVYVPGVRFDGLARTRIRRGVKPEAEPVTSQLALELTEKSEPAD